MTAEIALEELQTGPKTFTDVEKILALALPGYESRPGQQKLAATIETDIAAQLAAREDAARPDGSLADEYRPTHLLAHAPCGIGKSLAYLIPAILSGARVLVSVTTKALQGQLCVAPETKILTADLRHIPASEVYVGQHLMGFDEERDGTRRRYKDSVVESVSEIVRPCYELEFDDGTKVVCSSEHRWLCGHTMEIKWMTTEQLCVTKGKRPGSKVIRLTDVWDEDNSWEAGYLAGLYDGEGCLSQGFTQVSTTGHHNTLTFSQVDNETLKTGLSILDEYGIDYSMSRRIRPHDRHQDCFVPRITYRSDIMRVLGQFRPQRLLAKFNPDLLGTISSRRGGQINGQRVVRKTFLGDCKVLAIKTSTRTYIAEGLASHNCSKDIPFLQTHLPEPFTWAELRGRSNYLCLTRANSVEDPATLSCLDTVTNYVRTHPEFDGLRESLPFEIPDNEWWDMHADTDDCKAAGCANEQPEQVEVAGELLDVYSCYAVKARRKAANADLVIANHALLCVDLAIGNAILGDRDIIVLDEMHELESVAAESLGFRFAVRSFTKLAADVHTFAHQHALGEDAEALDPATDELTARATELFAAVDAIKFPPNESTRRLKEEALDEIAFGLTALRNAVLVLRRLWRSASFDLQGSKRIADRRNRLSSTLRNAVDNLTVVLDAEQTEWVRWIEIEKVKGSRRGGASTRRVIKAAPVSIAAYLDAKLWSQIPTIGVSATLKVKGSFRFLADRLGITQAITLTVDSPFDFRRQGALYVPTHLPVPKGAGLATFRAAAVEEIVELINASRGRTMVLFTATKDMQLAAETIRRRSRIPYELFVQFEATNKVLQDKFKTNIDSVLFATRSFFTGVDFAGETLSSLIIVKLPFAVPTEPITEARSERLEAEGKSSFGDYSLPMMSLLIQQATGRLIRHTSDIGVVTCLDPRLSDTGYGKQILKDLPPFPLTRQFEDVQRFFATH